jgi:hypothetical protein
MDDQTTDREGGAMSMKVRCASCGGSNLQPGKLSGYGGRTAFIPDNIRFLTLSQGARVSAVVCMDCGSITLRADPSDIAPLLKDEKEFPRT